MRRKSLVQQMVLVIAALITAAGLTASSASAQTTGAVSGTLTMPGGAAAENVSVYLDGPAFGFATTNSLGSYTISNVTPGQYRVRFIPQGRPAQYAYGKSNYYDANVFTVAAGGTVTVNDTLLPTATLSGRFVGQGGAGVPSVRVAALPTSSSGQSVSTTAGADGSFTMGVLPGTYRVEFSLPGGFRQYAYGASDWDSAAIITAPQAGQTVTVNDTMLATGSLVGRVVTATGTPVANSQVQAASNTNNQYSYTDQSGNYRFDNLIPGAYRVSALNSAGMYMYAPQTQSWSQAQLYQVNASQATTLNITFLPTGTVAGRFTDGGAGVSGVAVTVSNDFGSAWTTTNANGDYNLGNVFGGAYKVQFTKQDPQINQFAHGKVSQEAANVFTLTPGTTLTVDDTRLSAGTLRITARDSLSGAQIQEFYADVYPFWGSTQNGVVTMNDIPTGTYKASIWGPGYDTVERTITITGGQQTDLAITLAPLGKVPLTVVDAATNAPVQGVCVFLQYEYTPTIPDGCDGTDENGRVELFGRTGRYTIMALPQRGSGYGVQWVGPTGGTGDQRQAAVISVVNGQTATAPTIRLDRAGSIAGRVTSETGQPVKFGSVSLLTVSSSVGGSGWGASINSDGTYLLDGLGPYQWPLLLEAQGHAYQWSGDKIHRFDAQKIQVTSGGTATYNHVLKVGTAVITGTIKDQAGNRLETWLGAYNSVTGDYAGQAYAVNNENFEIRVLAPQQVKLASYPYWFNGTSAANAGLLSVGAGSNLLSLCVDGPNTMSRCGRPAPVPEPPRPSTPPGPRR